MTHLTECDGVDMKGISKAFQATFESPSTFCWVEACMTFQPDSVVRLLAGLEEAIEYVSGLTPNDWPEREPSCIFFSDWCHALQGIFEEYGSILSHRPWEVHFLDLQKPFLGVGQLYNKYGDTPHRDTIRYIDGYNSPRSCRPKPRADQQLLQDSENYGEEIYFIHDERRRLYFWGYTNVAFNNTLLFVQNAVTGQRLPPAVRVDGEADERGTLASYGLSPSGEYIVLVYNIGPNNGPWSKGSLTLIWQINDRLNFTRRLRGEPWAKICFSHECESNRFTRTATNVVFLGDGYCLTPSGQIHLASNSRRPLSNLLPKHFDSAYMDIRDSFFSPNGKYLFITKWLEDSQAVRLALFTETSEYLCSWKDSRRKVVHVSPSGRLLVLSPHAGTIFPGEGEETLCLHDVSTSETLLLPFGKELDYYDPKFHFNENEMELMMFTGIHSNSTMNVFVWSDLQLQPFLKSHGELRLEPSCIFRPAQIHINDDECSALMVLQNRVIQRVDLRPEVTFPDAPDIDDDYPGTTSQMSKDGMRWARLDYGQSKARLQMTDLSDARSSIQKLDLELSTSDDRNSRAVAFSPNLDTLVVDAQIYSITQGRNGLTFTSFTIQGLSDLIARHRSRSKSRYWRHLESLISPCNSYVIYFSSEGSELGEASDPIVYAFRVNLVSRSSARLNLHLPEDLVFFSAGFHPSLPLMLVSYITSYEPSVQDWGKGHQEQVSIIELESLGMEPADLPHNTSLNERIRCDRSQPQRTVQLSECGRFVVMTPSLSSDFCYVIHKLDAEPVTTRYHKIGYWCPHTWLTPSGGHVMKLERINPTSDSFGLKKLPKGDIWEEASDLTRAIQDNQPVYLDNLLCYPSSVSDSDRILLLGENDDEEMHVLIAPREGHALEIRPLSFSFNDAKRRLEIEWEKRRALNVWTPNRDIEVRHSARRALKLGKQE